MSQINETSNLPRGLVTRKGLPQTSTQRLPSLRSDVIASQLSPFVGNATTKGGVNKRTFKPKIPAKRNINDGSQSSDNSYDNTSRSRGGRSNGNNWHNRPKFDKKLIQLEATVFNGDRSANSDKQPRRSSSRSKDTIIRDNINKTNGESLNVSIKTEPNIKKENKSVDLRKLYGDNFIDDEEDDDYGSNHLLPKGWQAVSNHRVSNRCAEQIISPYDLFNSGENDKYLLMQFPESVLKRRDGHIGKIRVFKSGKIELHDNQSETIYDIAYSNHNLPQVKTEHKFVNKANGIYTQDISQDLVCFSDNHLSLLGSLKHQQQVLLAVPQIPFDVKISSSFKL